jgi:hypothetical protein
MATTIILTWPNFTVNVAIVYSYFKANLSSNFDGLYGTENNLTVIFKADYSDTDNTIISNYWNSITAQMFLPTVTQQVNLQINNAITFGMQLLVQYATQNVLAGITQAGQTIPVATYLQNLQYYLSTGSLYAGITELNNLIADTSSTKAALSPFITNNILYGYLNQIQTYLNVPLTANPGS